MANTLYILNDPPYGTERSYNGLRLAGARRFLLGTTTPKSCCGPWGGPHAGVLVFAGP